MRTFSLCKAKLNLCFSLHEVDLHRDECQALLADLAKETVDLTPMQQQLAWTLWFMVSSTIWFSSATTQRFPRLEPYSKQYPPDTRTNVIVEVVDEDDERSPSEMIRSDPIWLHRGTDATDTGIQGLNLIRSIAVPRDACWWIAGEREAVRKIRDSVVSERAVERDRISLNAYWRLVPIDPMNRTES